MALINIQANFSALIGIFSRIADALERAVPPPVEVSTRKRGPESIIQYGNGEREWVKENVRQSIHEQGFPPEREESLMSVAMKRYDYERKHRDPNEVELED